MTSEIRDNPKSNLDNIEVVSKRTKTKASWKQNSRRPPKKTSNMSHN